MKVCKVKRNSMITIRKLRLNDYANKHDKNIVKNNITRIQIPQNNKPKSNINNNLYLKSEFNIQKNKIDDSGSLAYIKSLPSHINKKQFYITPSKLKNKDNNNNPPDVKTEKNEESLSTFPITKENMIITPQKNENDEENKNNQRSLSCAQRSLNKTGKNMIFVKKKIQGNLKNSFILSKTDSEVNPNNSCCFFGEINELPKMKFNPNNSMDYGCNNYYNNNNNNKDYMNIINNLDSNKQQIGNSVVITNNNINLITNNNYINSTNKEDNEINNDNLVLRTNNSAILRSNKNKKINRIRVVQNVNNNIINKNPKRKNIINYFQNMNKNLLNDKNNQINYNNIITKEVKIYNPKREKDIKIKKKNINYTLMNNNNNLNLNVNNQHLLSPKINDLHLKELNYEDFYLLMQKFEIIKNNIILLGNLKNCSNKQLLENINMSRIFIYDLYKFYLGSSIEGCPQNLYDEKNAKLFLHFYSVILILSLGLMFVITHKIKMTKDYQDKLLNLIKLQQKAFLIFCDAMIKKINTNDNNIKDIWINEIIHELNNRKILYTTNHIVQIRNLSINSYEMFNDMIMSIYISNNDNKTISKQNDQEIFLYKHFYNKAFNYLANIKIHDLEDIFDKNIFKIINLRSNFANITSLKSNNLNITRSNNFKPQNKINNTNNTNLIFKDENINNNQNPNYNKYEFSIKPLLYLNKKNIRTHQKNNSGINPKNYLLNLKIKEPYLDFPPQKEYTLVLDLDETMISFQFTQPQNGIGQMHLRPGLENFLDVIKEYYEIIVFTSGTREYADMVLDVIEHKKQKKFFSGRLYREHTIRIGKKYIKDLSKLGRDLSKTLIVDNLPQSFKFQHENGILISSFYADENDKKDDRALIELQKILIKIYEDKNDVRLSILKYKEEIIRNVSCLDLRNYYDDE